MATNGTCCLQRQHVYSSSAPHPSRFCDQAPNWSLKTMNVLLKLFWHLLKHRNKNSSIDDRWMREVDDLMCRQWWQWSWPKAKCHGLEKLRWWPFLVMWYCWQMDASGWSVGWLLATITSAAGCTEKKRWSKSSSGGSRIDRAATTW